MDTSTHFVMGLGLFGLAHLDPAMTVNTDTAQAILIGTVAGSQIPDIDALYRLRGSAIYIRHHRGWSHSLPMLLLWPTLLTLLLLCYFPHANGIHVWLWTLLAVVIHVFIDLFNTYGTQALRPLSQRWISWNTIHIFDPFLFILHLVGFLLCAVLPISAGIIFAFIYLILILYLVWRSWVHQRVVEWVKAQVQQTGRYTITPTLRWHVWHVIVETTEKVHIGEIHGKSLLWTGLLSAKDLTHPAVIQSKQADPVHAFHSFTSYGYPQVIPRPYGYEVRWLDVRYHYKKHFPFVAVALLDHDYHPVHAFVGWMSKEQLEKRVESLLI
jgi:inner membrane protein